MNAAWCRGYGTVMLLTLLVAGCGTLPGGGPVTSHGGPVRDHVSLVDALRGTGLTVDPTGSVQQPFLHAQSGTVLRLSQGTLSAPVDIQSYDYGSADEVRSDMSHLDSKGNPRGAQAEWHEAPHLFARERLVVVYLGSDAAVLKLLNQLVGAQVSGAAWTRPSDPGNQSPGLDAGAAHQGHTYLQESRSTSMIIMSTPPVAILWA